MDGRFQPVFELREVTDSNNEIDFISEVSISNTKGGQYFRPTEKVV